MSQSGVTTAAGPEPDRAGRPMLILLVLALSTFAVTVMQSMVMPVLSDLAGSLDVSLSTVAWVLTVSQLSAAVFTPLLGSLGDALGRKRILLVTLGLVTLGSVLVAASSVFALVLVGRVLQGLGFAAMPLAIGIIRSVFPAERVASGIALVSAITGIGAGAGLLIAGLLAKAGMSGQDMFWIAGGVTLLGLVGAATLIRLPERARRFTVDYWGLLTLSGGLVCLLLGINRGPSWGWGSGGVLGLFAGALVLLVAWVLVEQRVAQPLVDIGMMRRPVVFGTNLTAFLTGAGMFGAFVLVIQFVQTPSRVGYGFDGDALDAGLTLLPMTAGTLVAAAAVSALIRHLGPKPPMVVGTVVATLTFGFLLLWHTEHWQFAVASAILGLGLGMAMGAMPTLLNTAVSPEQTSVANSVNSTLRSVGGSIGTTIATTILAAMTIAGTPLPSLDAYTTAFWVAGGICVLAVIAALAVPYRHRSARVGAQAAAAAEPARVAALVEPAPAAGPAVVGTVSSSGGAPLSGAAVTLTDGRGEQVGRTRTGSDGGFAIPVPVGGTFLLVVAAEGLAPSVEAVPVAEAPVRRDVRLTGGARLLGTVREDGAAPLDGVDVLVIDASGDVVGGARTDARGGFVVEGLPAGDHTLTATRDGRAPVAVRLRTSGEVPTTVDVVLPRRSVLRGTVTAGPDGRVVPEAVASLLDGAGAVVGSVSADGAGGFAFHDLPAGTYTLTTTGYAPQVHTVDVPAGGTTDVRIALGSAALRS